MCVGTCYTKTMKTLETQIDKQLLKKTLKKYGVVRAAIFGSFARGDDRMASDLDLLVDYKDGTSLFDVIDLQKELEDLFGRSVDLVSRKFMPDRLAKRIKAELVPLNLD